MPIRKNAGFHFTELPPPPPSGGGIPPILYTNYENPPVCSGDDLCWIGYVCNNQTFFAHDPPKWEWTQIQDPNEQYDREVFGLSGTVISQDLSSLDMPFTHPFGFDWEFYVAPDEEYRSLLAPSNKGKPDAGPDDPAAEYAKATSLAEQMGLPVPKGVLGVEIDQDLIPGQYRAQERDRIAVFGRWIVDCGHDDFHTEIHPPLLLAFAREGSRCPGVVKETISQVITRPYLIGQDFIRNGEDDGPARSHLLKEVVRVYCPFFPISAFFNVCSNLVEAHPQIMHKPFSDVQLFNYFVRPPMPRQNPSDFLVVRFHFIKRRSGVAIQVYKAADDTVGVAIALIAEEYVPPPLPQKRDWDLTLDDIRRFNREAAAYYELAIAGGAILDEVNPFPPFTSINPAAPILLARGIRTDRYDQPVFIDNLQEEVEFIPVDNLVNLGNTPVVENDIQAFPIYGWLRVEWAPLVLIRCEDPELEITHTLETTVDIPDVDLARAMQLRYSLTIVGLQDPDITWTVQSGDPAQRGLDVVLPPNGSNVVVTFDLHNLPQRIGFHEYGKIVKVSVKDRDHPTPVTDCWGLTIKIHVVQFIPG